MPPFTSDSDRDQTLRPPQRPAAHRRGKSLAGRNTYGCVTTPGRRVCTLGKDSTFVQVRRVARQLSSILLFESRKHRSAQHFPTERMAHNAPPPQLLSNWALSLVDQDASHRRAPMDSDPAFSAANGELPFLLRRAPGHTHHTSRDQSCCAPLLCMKEGLDERSGVGLRDRGGCRRAETWT